MFVGFVSWALRILEGILIGLGAMFVWGLLEDGPPQDAMDKVRETVIFSFSVTMFFLGLLTAGLQTLIEQDRKKI